MYHSASSRSCCTSSTTSLNLRTASSTCASSSRLKLARTYAVRSPFGRNTVPGSASTPRANARVRMTAAESPDGTSSLNLRADERGKAYADGRHRPVEHARLGRRPLAQACEVRAHRALEHVTALPVEGGDVARVQQERLVAPRVQQRVRDRLRQADRLQVRRRRLPIRMSYRGTLCVRCAHVHLDRGEQRRGPAGEADAYPGGEHLG